jgi:hypothetical protein
MKTKADFSNSLLHYVASNFSTRIAIPEHVTTTLVELTRKSNDRVFKAR